MAIILLKLHKKGKTIFSYLNKDKQQLQNIALALGIVTVVYNIAEGMISLLFGIEDESLTLLGFGIDSFVEVVSGIGIVHLLIRIKQNRNESRDSFEKTALKITGVSFYILFSMLTVNALFNIISQHHPTATLWGTIISLVSISTMSFLMNVKLKVGNALNSAAIVADANCTKTCLYLSVVLLAASLIYSFTGFGFADSIGAFGIAYFSFKEGKEAMEKSKTGKNCSCSH